MLGERNSHGVSSTIPKLFEKKIFLLRGMDREIRNLSAWKTNLRIVKFLNSLKTTESVRKYGVVMNLKYITNDYWNDSPSLFRFK